MKIVFLDSGSFPAWATFDHRHLDWVNYAHTAPSDVVIRALTADIIVTNKVVLNAEILKGLPQLKFIAVAATGTNNVDLDFCRQQGIAVANVSGYAANTVAEHIVACLFALRRSLPSYRDSMAAGEWSQAIHFCHFAAPITDVVGTVMGIVGKGAIGQSLASKCEALGMTVRFIDSRETSESSQFSLKALLPQVDHLALCCPLTPQTENLIDHQAMALMKQDAVIINTSRGGIVNELALVSALQEARIAGAAMDVSVQEPLPLQSPLYALIDNPRFILTPHVGWSSKQGIEQLIAGVMNNIADFISGGGSHFLVPPKVPMSHSTIR